MNIASWIILVVILVWIIIAVKAAFFGGFKKRRVARAESDDATRGKDASYRIDVPRCGGCDKAGCAGCPIANRDIPMPTIHELE